VSVPGSEVKGGPVCGRKKLVSTVVLMGDGNEDGNGSEREDEKGDGHHSKEEVRKSEN